jgi:hypothetical protein
MISFGSTASARAMPMRWRWTAGELVRITCHVIGAQADGLQQIDHALFELLLGFGQLIDDQRLADDRADIHARIERGVRVLKDDLDVAAQDARSSAPSDRTSLPSKWISPPLGSIRRSTQRPVVDLPQPDSPTRPSV